MDCIDRRPILLAILCLAATGCATTQVASTAVRTADAPAWHATAQSVTSTSREDLSHWWERFGDETLTALIERGLRESPSVDLARARLRQVRAQRAQTASGLWPTVGVSGSASGSRSGGATGSFAAAFDASWEPDVFGGTRRAVDAATADVAASEADVHSTQVTLAGEIAVEYVNLRALQVRLDITTRNAASQQETLELTGFRAQAGLVSSVDVEQARANVEQTRAQIPTLESSIAQTNNRLATLVGAPAGSLADLLEPAAPLPNVPGELAIGIPADTIRQRPDITAAERRIVAETARLQQAGTRRYPQFTLSGTLGADVLTGALTSGVSTVASLAGKVAQTLFDRGRISQQIEMQSAVQEQAVATYESTVLAALEDVENALVAMDKTREQLVSLNTARTAADNAALLARSQYSAGLADFQTVLSTERSALTLQQSVATAEGDRLTAVVQLYKAVGGGWTPAPTTTTSTGNPTP